jgi:uncharacterized protein (TIRG00374 family)
LWVIGLLLLGGLVVELGLDLVFERLQTLGWNVIPVVSIAILWHTSNTLAWRACFDKDDPDRPGFWQLAYTKLAGEAVGNVTPASHLGSELAKVYMLRPKMSATRGLPSLVVNKTIELITGLFFAMCGTILAFRLFEIDERVRLGLVVALGISSVGIGLAFLGQRRKTFEWFLDLLLRLRITFLEKRRAQIQETDQNIAAFYRRNPRGFAESFILHGFSWIFGSFEIYYILTILNEPLTFTTALLLASLSSIITAAFFFVPSGLGVFEGGHAILFHLLGLDPVLGLSVGLIRRIRKIFWVIVGFGLMFFSRKREFPGPPSASVTPSP